MSGLNKIGKKHLQKIIESHSVPVTETGCWLWEGHCDRNGYGQKRLKIFDNKNMFAHRLSYLAYIGNDIENKSVCHKCDVPCCVNPDHLFLGSHKDNMSDMSNKKRNRVPHPKMQGENHFNARLTEKDVIEIRKKFKPRVNTYKMLSEEYGISPRTVGAIVNRSLWSHV